MATLSLSPYHIHSLLDLKGAYKDVFLQIRGFANRGKRLFASRYWIAKRLNKSERHIRRALSKLEKLGLIHKVSRYKSTNIYSLTEKGATLPNYAAQIYEQKTVDKGGQNHTCKQDLNTKNVHANVHAEHPTSTEVNYIRPYINNPSGINLTGIKKEKRDDDDVYKWKKEREIRSQSHRNRLNEAIGPVSYYLDKNSLRKVDNLSQSQVMDVIEIMLKMLDKNRGFLKNPSAALTMACKQVQKQTELDKTLEYKSTEQLTSEEIELLKKINIVEDHRVISESENNGWWISENLEWKYRVYAYTIEFFEYNTGTKVKVDALSDNFYDKLDSMWHKILKIKNV